MFCLDISRYSTSIVCGQGVQNYTVGEVECSISFLCRPGQVIDILRAQLSPLGEVYGMSRQDVWRARVQYLVLVPHGAVHRWVTRAVIAAWGSVRYVIDARDRTSGMHECGISFECRTGQYTDLLRLQ